MKRFGPRYEGGKHSLGTHRVKIVEHCKLASVFAAILAACVFNGSLAASTEAAISARYGVRENFSHEFGSKFASGYFVREIDRCLVTLKIAEKGTSESRSGQTAAHVRLVLNPGQKAGLDSEEGQSLNLTCGTNATALILDSGGKAALTAAQKQALSDSDFSEFVIP